ncbi:L,D-transpeptidase [Candidatus Woesearchaeota archaeon]|nr:L,D-transpeptidase [Candidatus Woesearchaeota archaeon]
MPTVTPTFTPILTFTPTSTSTPTPTPQLLEKCRIIYIELEEPQTIYAAYNCFDGTPVYVIYTTLVSAGLSATPTPTGDFKIFEKIESRAMSGPGYYLEGVPHIMYFKERGYAIHGAYWHNNFGHPMSHGCVNLPLDDAEWFYDWAEVGTLVTIQQDFDDIPFEFYIEE